MSKIKVSVKGTEKSVPEALAKILIRKGLAKEIDENIKKVKIKKVK